MEHAEQISLTERWLAQLVERTVGLEPGQALRDTPLQQLGLRSIHAAQLVAALEDRLGTELDPADLVAYPTIAALADYADRVARGEIEPDDEWS